MDLSRVSKWNFENEEQSNNINLSTARVRRMVNYKHSHLNAYGAYLNIEQNGDKTISYHAS